MGAAAAAGVTAVGAIGGAAISGSGKGRSSAAGTTEATHTPWGPQGAALSDALGGATNVYNDRNAQGPYQGPLYGQRNYLQEEGAQHGVNYANGNGYDAENRANYVGGQAQDGLGQSMQASTNIARTGMGQQNGALMGALTNIGDGQQRAVNAPLSDALHASATAGASSIGGYNAGLDGIMHSAQADPTQQLAGSAQTYMNSGATQQMMQNVHNQIGATLNETTVPGLNRQAAMGGNLNSSRAGMAEAMANRDAALTEGNADAQIQNNAFNTGLGVASSQRTAGLNTATSAATAGMSGNSSLALGTGNQDISATGLQVGAATAGLGQQTQHQSADVGARLGAAGQLISGVNTGLGADHQAQILAANNAGLISQAGGMYAQDAQARATEAYQKYNMNNTYRQGVLNDYMNNVTKPQGYYNASSASQQTSTPPSSMGTLVAGGAAAAGSLFAKGGALNGVFGSDSNAPPPSSDPFGGAGVSGQTFRQ